MFNKDEAANSPFQAEKLEDCDIDPLNMNEVFITDVTNGATFIDRNQISGSNYELTFDDTDSTYRAGFYDFNM